MTLRTPLSRARGLGSAHEGAHHWWQQRVTAVAMIPLVFWFVASLASHVGADHAAMRGWLSSPLNATLLIALLVAVFHHAQLGLQVVFEDYVHCNAAKVAGIIVTKLLAVLFGIFSVVSVLMIAMGGRG
ncbi:succinate dehydrogenase, hydrophobic membrane anchor protein [Haematospirillum sp. H1815]|uniref:succinate dehydrogenase, hydrophobic membrane anchor protein n=1 Tax=Haematospirillum sp. H1815 TaxID=2723108 RepID=UPI00143C9A4D|nr:succinate dehydrogenase, hydrophobic membrane anchor protein [Haematospirillum sp. H1815]NKD77162.1 succinate dehydrogenase, hydrophobic membrane anchor protein [Haematospirillum sp. H1815]